ncbi:hypothetical protein JCM11491_006870 [Sporobolomyces phaffii]
MVQIARVLESEPRKVESGSADARSTFADVDFILCVAHHLSATRFRTEPTLLWCMSTPIVAPPAPSSAANSGNPSSNNRGRNRNRRGRGGATSAQHNAPAPDGELSGEAVAHGTRGRGGGRGGNRGASHRGAGRGRGRGGASQHNSLNEREPPHDHSASTSQPRRNGNSRRGRFNASLSNGHAPLHASASPFVPPTSSSSSSSALPSGASTPASAAPANQTLVERLTYELTTGDADCSICYESITRTSRIHSCSTCHTPFHLKCISAWGQTSVASSSEKARLLATRDPRNPPDPAALEGHWSCPNCATKFPPAAIPTKYKCFCGRFTDPQPPARGSTATPHSCAKPCKKPRPVGCRHPCALTCHPGPCPPCSVVLNEQCHCHKRVLGIRCSALHDGKAETELTKETKENLKSCGEEHGQVLSCGFHQCRAKCHMGDCGECREAREKKCFCGKETRDEPCGTTRAADRVEGCTVPSLAGGSDSNSTWTGEFECGSVCAAPYDCGHHVCDQICHPHLSDRPPPCPRSPSQVTSCPCGNTPLSALLKKPRPDCLAPIPTCTKPCSKPLASCGHSCRLTCHTGPCPPCTTTIPMVCRCGSSKTTRTCGSPLVDEQGSEVEYTCNRVCRAMRSCGRHVCARVCCPLSYQEALTVGKGKQKRRNLDSQWEQEMQDPLGIHACDRTCGRKLNCGIHACEQRDHKGACPPCLRADFDELSCHCGATVVFPPIPCGFQIDCRAPCVRPPPNCGHPQVPHACHENPECPPCPHLTSKPCACSKKVIPNLRCSIDQRKVSCGTTCGKLLRCGFHRCQKTCHPPGECDEQDNQICLKPRKHCNHPCPLPCHFPSSCPADQPCPKMIEVTCACGHLIQQARCGACDSKPEGNMGRQVKCTDACAVAKRNAQLADALGVEKKEPKIREVEYDQSTLAFYAANLAWCKGIEEQLIEFVKGEKASLHLPVMKRPQRQFTHELAEAFELRSVSLDVDPHRSVLVERQSNSAIPTPNLADALAASRKVSSTTLNLGSLRKALPERKPNNALYFEGVLGYDEQSLQDMLRPHMKGLKFSLTWVTDEDVLASFEGVPVLDLEAKLGSIASTVRHLISDSGFCYSVECVVLSEDGRVVRGSWTPVASGGTKASLDAKKSLATPLKTANAFAAFGSSARGGGGGGGGGASASHENVWGSLVGLGHNRPPRAVVAPYAEQDLPPISLPTLTQLLRAPSPTPVNNDATASVTLPVDAHRDDADVPDDWDDDVEGREEAHEEEEGVDVPTARVGEDRVEQTDLHHGRFDGAQPPRPTDQARERSTAQLEATLGTRIEEQKKVYPRPPAPREPESFRHRPSSPIQFAQPESSASSPQRSLFSRSTTTKPPSTPKTPGSKIPWEPPSYPVSSSLPRPPPLSAAGGPARPSSPLSTSSYTSSGSSSRWSQTWATTATGGRSQDVFHGRSVADAPSLFERGGGWSEDDDDDASLIARSAAAAKKAAGTMTKRGGISMRQAFGLEKKSSAFSLRGFDPTRCCRRSSARPPGLARARLVPAAVSDARLARVADPVGRAPSDQESQRLDPRWSPESAGVHGKAAKLLGEEVVPHGKAARLLGLERKPTLRQRPSMTSLADSSFSDGGGNAPLAGSTPERLFDPSPAETQSPPNQHRHNDSASDPFWHTAPNTTTETILESSIEEEEPEVGASEAEAHRFSSDSTTSPSRTFPRSAAACSTASDSVYISDSRNHSSLFSISLDLNHLSTLSSSPSSNLGDAVLLGRASSSSFEVDLVGTRLPPFGTTTELQRRRVASLASWPEDVARWPSTRSHPAVLARNSSWSSGSGRPAAGASTTVRGHEDVSSTPTAASFLNSDPNPDRPVAFPPPPPQPPTTSLPPVPVPGPDSSPARIVVLPSSSTSLPTNLARGAPPPPRGRTPRLSVANGSIPNVVPGGGGGGWYGAARPGTGPAPTPAARGGEEAPRQSLPRIPSLEPLPSFVDVTKALAPPCQPPPRRSDTLGSVASVRTRSKQHTSALEALEGRNRATSRDDDDDLDESPRVPTRRQVRRVETTRPQQEESESDEVMIERGGLVEHHREPAGLAHAGDQCPSFLDLEPSDESDIEVEGSPPAARVVVSSDDARRGRVGERAAADRDRVSYPLRIIPRPRRRRHCSSSSLSSTASGPEAVTASSFPRPPSSSTPSRQFGFGTTTTTPRSTPNDDPTTNATEQKEEEEKRRPRPEEEAPIYHHHHQQFLSLPIPALSITPASPSIGEGDDDDDDEHYVPFAALPRLVLEDDDDAGPTTTDLHLVSSRGEPDAEDADDEVTLSPSQPGEDDDDEKKGKTPSQEDRRVATGRAARSRSCSSSSSSSSSSASAFPRFLHPTDVPSSSPASASPTDCPSACTSRRGPRPRPRPRRRRLVVVVSMTLVLLVVATAIGLGIGLSSSSSSSRVVPEPENDLDLGQSGQTTTTTRSAAGQVTPVARAIVRTLTRPPPPPPMWTRLATKTTTSFSRGEEEGRRSIPTTTTTTKGASGERDDYEEEEQRRWKRWRRRTTTATMRRRPRRQLRQFGHGTVAGWR